MILYGYNRLLDLFIKLPRVFLGLNQSSLLSCSSEGGLLAMSVHPQCVVLQSV